MSSDHKYFNCSEEHEFEYVSSLYEEKDNVYKQLKAWCKDNTINYSTHDEVYDLLENAGFIKK